MVVIVQEKNSSLSQQQGEQQMSDETANCIWLSRAMQDSRNGRALRPMTWESGDHILTPEEEDLYRRSRVGEVIEEHELVKDLYFPKDWNDHKKPIRHIMSSGVLVVTEKSAEVLQNFDLGKGGLYAVDLYLPDRKTKMDGNFYYLNIATKKNAFLPEQCLGRVYRPYGEKYEVWTANPNHEDDEYVFSPDALKGADLWFDERFNSSFFISNRLMEAMKAAKVAKDWHALRCPIVKD